MIQTNPPLRQKVRKFEMEEIGLTLDDAKEAADILRGMLDEELRANDLLRKRNKELELLLMQNDICIPDYDVWHGGILPMV